MLRVVIAILLYVLSSVCSRLVQILDPFSRLISKLQKWRTEEPEIIYSDKSPRICTISVVEKRVSSAPRDTKKQAKQDAAFQFLAHYPCYLAAPPSPPQIYSWDTLLQSHRGQHLVTECSFSFKEEDLAVVRQCPLVAVDCEGVTCSLTGKVSLAVLSLYAGDHAWMLPTADFAAEQKALLLGRVGERYAGLDNYLG